MEDLRMWKILQFLNEYGITHRIIDKGAYSIVKIMDYTIVNEFDDYFTLKKSGKVLLTESGAEHFINCLHQHGYKTILLKATKK